MHSKKKKYPKDIMPLNVTILIFLILLLWGSYYILGERSNYEVSIPNLKCKVYQLTFFRGTDQERICQYPTVSPDGQYIAFQYSTDPKRITVGKAEQKFEVVDFPECDCNWDIYRLKTNGSELIKLTDDPRAESEPAWAPDNNNIVYRVFNGEKKGFDLYMMEADGTHKHSLPLATTACLRGPSFSPDGKKIVFFSDQNAIREGKWHLYMLNVKSNEMEQLTYGDYDYTYPVFTQDAEKIIFCSSCGGERIFLKDQKVEHKLSRIWMLDLKNMNLTQLTKTNGKEEHLHPKVSPDGRFIIYSVNKFGMNIENPKEHLIVKRDLYIMGNGRKMIVNLTKNDDRSFMSPCWSADGKGVYFVFQPESKMAYNVGYMDVTEVLEKLDL